MSSQYSFVVLKTDVVSGGESLVSVPCLGQPPVLSGQRKTVASECVS